MLTPRDPAHYLSSLKTTTTPKRLLWLDCAAKVDRSEGVSVERWRAGALGRTWYTSKRNQRRDAVTAHWTPEELWADANSFCLMSRRVVLWAYDLALQLRISQALVHLPALGWRLDKIVLERTAAWALLRDHARTLLMCDLRSWAPVDFSALVGDVYGSREDQPQLVAGPDYHLERCKERINVIRGATTQILHWIEGENLGQFRPTGSGQSYSSYRRRFMAHNLLVHDDTERLHAERLAMWTGRCEAWKHGHLTNGPYVEYDMQAAYCRIAAECDIPTTARGETNTRDMAKLIRRADDRAILAHVTVTTDVPVLPAKLGGRTVWPVGEFSTWVWDPELRLAADYCHDVIVHRAYEYDVAPALQSFARFVLAGLEGQTQIYGSVPHRVLKHWSRCLVGRFGLRYRSWLPFGSQPYADLRLVTYLDVDDGTSTDVLVAGYDRMILSDMSEAADSMPQIPSWIMSECRARLWRAMLGVGLDAVVYMDTDSLVYRQPMDDEYLHAAFEMLDTQWTVKGTYQSMTIYGPRNLVCNTDRRVSGLPKSARQLAPLEFSGQVMRSIKESMRNGELDCVASIPRKFVMDAPDMRRQHLPNHATAPFRVQLPTEG